MSWDPHGFCLRCQRHLDDGCDCPGAVVERRRRGHADGQAAAGSHVRIIRNEPPVQGPHPADRLREGEQPAAEPVLPGIPDYPVAALTGPLADLVSSTTLPSALVAGAGLAALAGICGDADLVMPDESLVRSVLWVPLVAPRGAGKTPSMDKALGKLRELDAVAHDEYRTRLAEYQAMSVKDRASAGMPRDTTRRIDDVTLEVVARWLDCGDGTGVVEADELSGWLESIGQYKRSSGDKGRWLALWSEALPARMLRHRLTSTTRKRRKAVSSHSLLVGEAQALVHGGRGQPSASCWRRRAVGPRRGPGGRRAGGPPRAAGRSSRWRSARLSSVSPGMLRTCRARELW